MLMKKILLFCLVMFMAVGANAQYRRNQRLYVTTNNVSVRTGPGKNYGVATYYDDCDKNSTVKAVFNKGTGVCALEFGILIEYLGQSKNGYLKVNCQGNGCPSDQFTGWIQASYLKPVCSKCGGIPDGYEMENNFRKCPKCHGRGY